VSQKHTRGKKWDGKSRVSTDLYRKRWDEIFKKKKKKEKLEDTQKLLEEIADRNGF
tara:strand:+ start:982 stop:1149 length:168 start_codon:yes stop_codon:yes gene_type:complete